MNIDEIDRKWINIAAVVAIMICLLITLAVWNIWAHPANDEVIMNTTIEENVTPTPTPAPEENITIEELIYIHDLIAPEEPTQEENCTTTIGGVVINQTVELVEDECIMRVDGETIQITDEDIHNALMTCAIEDMTFEEFKRHVRDRGIDS